ncbi:MAG: rhomboid family intramembrane serine protease [Bacteroidales bacterium]|nr:rhomboid family intramembrane serine protease [Bacteroidales bacterium]
MVSFTTLIIIVTCVISVAAFEGDSLFPESLRRPEWTDKLKFNAYAVWHGKQYYRVLSYGFVHGGMWHLVFNMLTLYFFGPYVESCFLVIAPSEILGKILYLLFYISALAVSTSVDLAKQKDNAYFNAVGASGAVSAVLFASILFNPRLPVAFMFIPIPIPGWIFGILYLVYCYVMAKKNIDNIGHTAHLMGAVYGLIFPILIEPRVFNVFLKNLPFFAN